jgi:hypothetical protein
MLYRTVVEDVPVDDYIIPLGQARIARTGGDITLVGWGQQVAVLERAVSHHPLRVHLSPLTARLFLLLRTCVTLSCKAVLQFLSSECASELLFTS